MSKDITIQEGGVGRQFGGVAKLRTDQQGGGSVYWVPEEEVQLTNKSITENGTYYAADDGVYGWDTINVSVAGGEGGIGSSIVGIDPIDGNEWMYTVDDGTGGGEPGEITSLKLPSSIAVTTPPTKTEYTDGETINPSGIVVHGYYADGTDYGTLLNSELRYDPIVADISQITPESEEWTVDGLIPPVYMIHISEGEGNPMWGDPSKGVAWYATDITGTAPVYLLYAYTQSDRSNAARVFCSLAPFVVKYRKNQPGYYDTHVETVACTNSSTYDGQTAYVSGASSFSSTYREMFPYNGGLSLVSEYQNTMLVQPTAIKALNGGSPVLSGGQPITVKWNRIGDGKELTTTFDITVTEAESSGDSGDSGGSSGTSHWQEETGQYDP